MRDPSFVLAAVGGPGAGARMAVDAALRVVGRGRAADCVLLDPHVSRRHLQVTAVEGGVRVETLEDAEPFLFDGASRRDALLRAGDSIVVGDTVLTLDQEADPAAESVTTDVRSLMSGVAADVRGLTATMELVDGLDAAEDEAGIVTALRQWGARHAGAIDVTLTHAGIDGARHGGVDGAFPHGGVDGTFTHGGVDAAHERFLVERPGPERASVLVSAPAHAGSEIAWVTFRCPSSHGPLTDTTRRLVTVAARLAGSSLVRARSLQRARDDRELLRQVSLGSARSFLGASPAAREIARLVARLATSDTVVLLEGETGVGKTFLARLLHESSARAKEPLRVINCAAIPESLIESELFGHERGAFTGATASRAGALEAAGRGTVLLDEIADLPLPGQAKLLRVLEEKRFERLGSNRSVRLDARIIAATNRDLALDVEEGRFRGDLYYRIAVVKLRVPPLRERGDDLVLLARHLLGDLAPSAGRRVEGFSPAAVETIRRYPWPGNARELRNAIERALVVGDAPWIQPDDLPDAVHGAVPVQPDDESLARLPMRLDHLEARAIRAAMRAANGNQRRAAALLGINRVTLHRKLRAKDGGDG